MVPSEVEEVNWRLVNKVEQNADDIVEWEEVYTDDAETLILAYGGAARAAREAVEELRAQGEKGGECSVPFPSGLFRKEH